MTRLRFYKLLAGGCGLICSACVRSEILRREEDVSMDLLRKFWEEEDGMGTVEIVMIIAALMCIALLFRQTITEFASTIIKNVFPDDVKENIKTTLPAEE